MLHIDDLLLNRTKSYAETDHIEKLVEKHGSNDLLTLNVGKLHEFLGITLDLGVIRNDFTSTQCNFINNSCMIFLERLKGKKFMAKPKIKA